MPLWDQTVQEKVHQLTHYLHIKIRSYSRRCFVDGESILDLTADERAKGLFLGFNIQPKLQV